MDLPNKDKEHLPLQIIRQIHGPTKQITAFPHLLLIGHFLKRCLMFWCRLMRSRNATWV